MTGSKLESLSTGSETQPEIIDTNESDLPNKRPCYADHSDQIQSSSTSVWSAEASKSSVKNLVKTQEDEFDDYFADLFL